MKRTKGFKFPKKITTEEAILRLATNTRLELGPCWRHCWPFSGLKKKNKDLLARLVKNQVTTTKSRKIKK